MTRTSWILVCCCMLVFCNQMNGQATYSIDDGVSEIALGHGASGDFLWGNYFTEVSGGSMIETISVSFGNGGVMPGTPFEVAVYDDMDNNGDPTSGLMLLTSMSGTVDMPSPVGMDSFQMVDIPDTTISGGFFVAAFVDGATNPFPALMDQTTTVAQSWFSETDPLAGDLDVSDPFGPSSTLQGLVDDFNFPGNWLIRCNDTKDCVLGDVDGNGTVELLDVSPFVNAITKGIFSCEADVDQNGIVELLDVAPFVDILLGGGG